MKLNGITSLPCGYTIKDLKLKTKSGNSINIAPSLASISMTEAITNPAIYGTLEIVDTNNIVSNAPIQEGDSIEGTFTVYEEDTLVYMVDPIGGWTFTFEIIRIDVFRQKKDLQTVKLHFISPIWTNNMKGRISKTYEQVAYSEVVDQIFNEYLSGGGINQIFGNVGALFKKASSGLSRFGGSFGGSLGSIGGSLSGIGSSLSGAIGKVSSVVNQTRAVVNQVDSTLSRFGVNTGISNKVNRIQGKVSQAMGTASKAAGTLSQVGSALSGLGSGGFNSINGLTGGAFGNFGGGIKYLETEMSDGLYNFVIPNWKPLQAISWLAKRSIANNSSNFRFFETKDSFRFVTDTTLSQQSPIWTLYQEDQNIPFINSRVGNWVNSNWDMSKVPGRYGNIIAFKFDDIQDMNKASGKSVMGKHLITQDNTSKTVTDNKESAEAGGSVSNGGLGLVTLGFGFSAMNGGSSVLNKDTIDWFAGEDGEDKLAVYPTQAHQYDTGEENDKPNKWLRQHDSMTNQMDIYNVTVTVPGNFTVKCGDIVDIKWKSPQTNNIGMAGSGGIMSLMYDSCNSGNWLVKEITRTFRIGADGFTMEMKLAKNDKKFSNNFNLIF